MVRTSLSRYLIFPLTALFIVLTACENPDQPLEPQLETAPPATLDAWRGVILPIGQGLKSPTKPAMHRAPAGPSSTEALAYDAVPDVFPGSYPSLGFQATSTDELGDLIGLATPGVGKTVTVGMNSWTCENWETKAPDGACITTPGASYSHDLTLNLYQPDYSGPAPAVGPQIASVTQTFDIPFRPSWDDTECTAGGQTPADNVPFGGQWYDPVLDACVNGYAFKAEFDLSGLDVVLPPEVIYGVAYNTQTHGETPEGVAGPYNSLNVGVANLSAGSLGQPTVGYDVELDALFWDTSYGPFYSDGGAAGVDIFRRDTGWEPLTPIIAIQTTTTDGFVTGGGWIDSPAGAFNGAGNEILVDANPDANWAFNAETPYLTPADFSGDEARIGAGSIHVDPITNNSGTDADEKFILRYVPDTEIALADLDGFSIDFLIDDASTNPDPNQFYINLYTLTPDPNDGGWYDCRFDYVATSGSTTSWTTLGFDGSTAATATGDKLGGGCPSSFGAMPAGSTVLFVSVNLGDTSLNDAGVGGYFDNAVMSLSGTPVVFNFDPALTGKASFGFNAKYKKGANVPSGNTQFTFNAAGLNFHSDSYDWLIVNQNDSNAQFKGEGSVNGMPGYKFMLWGGDHDAGDTFRIKIWQDGSLGEQIVYDNGSDQMIAGGNIVVHSGKKK